VYTLGHLAPVDIYDGVLVCRCTVNEFENIPDLVIELLQDASADPGFTPSDSADSTTNSAPFFLNRERMFTYSPSGGESSRKTYESIIKSTSEFRPLGQ